MNRFEEISHYREQIKKLLEEKPELQALQDKIDEALSEIPTTDYQRRNQVIQEMLLNEWFKITEV